MYLRKACTLLAGLASLATAAPAPLGQDATPLEQGLKHKTRAQKRAPLIIQQNIIEPTVVVVEENLDTINNLALLAEQEFAALVQSQLSVLQTVEDIKNNIRVNHFKSRFNTVNTVIVTVTNVLDIRDANAYNNRYLINQLLADNGHPESEVVVMVTALDTMTIGLATPTLDLSGLLGEASAVSAPTGVPVIGSFDPNAPFGSFNESLVLPFGSIAPTLPNIQQIFADPAAIILPNFSGSLFVEDLAAFSQDCAFWGANSGSLFTLTAEVVTVQQIAAVQVAGLSSIGSGLEEAAALALLNGEQGYQQDDEKRKKDKEKEDSGKNDEKKSY